MSVQKDTNLWEFLESRNFDSTENLKELSLVLLSDKDALMNAYGWEYEQWLDETEENVDDGQDAYFNIIDQEEREYDKYASAL
jgi:hypothetical protein